MTLIRGGPAGPDGFDGAYPNEVETDRTALWHALGGRQGVIEGFVHAAVAGQMALDFTPGAVLAGERAADGTASLDRGYLVWSDSTTRVSFDPASVSARNDAVVAAFVDVEDGPLGTGVTEVGPQLVVVTGVSGTTTPRTDAQINSWLGRGGWVRLMDVPVAAGTTEINVAGIVTAGITTQRQRASMRQTVNQNIPTGTSFTKVDFNVTERDNAAMVSLTNDQITIPESGLYDIRGGFGFASNSNGRRIMRILVNGTERAREESASNAFWSATAAFDDDLVAGDVITMEVIQSSGGTLASNADSSVRIFLSARRAG